MWALLLGSGEAGAQAVSGADLARELSGNTLTGYNGWLWFSEYHAPDGRIFGFNGRVPAVDACWKVRGDAVCYYYPGQGEGGQPGRAEFCWRFERAGPTGYKIAPLDGVTPADPNRSGVARLDPGNAPNHTDNGRAWTCEPLMSGLPGPIGRRLAVSPAGGRG